MKKEQMIKSVKDFLNVILENENSESYSYFYRGHSDETWELKPGVLRSRNLCNNEDQLFRDLYSYNPSEFYNCTSTFDQLVKMQHYGLPTRLLDITKNPLIALYFACEYDMPKIKREGTIEERKNCIKEENHGSVYVFKISNNIIKSYDSDTVSILSNIAKCKKEQLEIQLSPDTLGPLEYDRFFKEIRKSKQYGYYLKQHLKIYLNKIKEEANNDKLNQLIYNIRKISSLINEELYLSELFQNLKRKYYINTINIINTIENYYSNVDLNIKDKSLFELNSYILNKNISCIENQDYIGVFNNQLEYLLHQIRNEKPHFKKIINPYDLGRIIIVRAKQSNQRIINQQGLFFLFGLGLSFDINKEDSEYKDNISYSKEKNMKFPKEWIEKEIKISKDHKESILKELSKLGITKSFIYPELEIYSDEIKNNYIR